MGSNHRVRRALLRVGLCLALAGAALGVRGPRPAEAADFVVDRSDDGLVTACTATENDCTLRGAIQVANTNGVTDTITFLGNRAITLLSTLELTADGTTIQATAGQTVTINANNVVGSNVFLIGANDITLERLRVYGSGANFANIWITDTAQRIKIVNNVIGDDAFDFGGCGSSPNSHSGIYIDSSANPSGNDAVAWIYGNSIKCNNGAPGIGIQINGAREVVIGADALGNATSVQNNIILDNAGDGVHLSSGATLNTLRNTIVQDNNGSGLVIDAGDSNSVYGSHFLYNVAHGIELKGGAQFNEIGLVGNSPGTRNVIGGNGGSGVRITGAGTNDNLVRGNRIGTNAAGTGPVPNLVDGVQIVNGASLNTIGGIEFDQLNLISGNAYYGVYISGSDTATNTVTSNDIGFNSLGAGLPIPNGADGIVLLDNTHANVIGGVGLANVSAYNLGNGLALFSGARTNSISVNVIFSNTRNGVLLEGLNTSLNLITGTVIFNNGQDGIAEGNSAGFNVWQHISTYANGGLGVDKFAASPSANVIDTPFPTIISVNTDTGQIAGNASPNAFVDVYLAYPDASGHGEGKTFVGGTLSNGSGEWDITVTPGLPGCFTAVEIVAIFIIFAASEFGPNTCLQSFVPIVRR